MINENVLKYTDYAISYDKKPIKLRSSEEQAANGYKDTPPITNQKDHFTLFKI
ncbi:hypothetical protein NIASO_15690 [Niabella soli DSM 19437]|uniref:Uncharacterized protein n=1 Tax=Niabella soli DSM 19437 TaxID=929713 RepID=W0F7T0_9BACT|nr:hypothetical protein NIASO_15690 [Niabella soli DSM 19437]